MSSSISSTGRTGALTVIVYSIYLRLQEKTNDHPYNVIYSIAYISVYSLESLLPNSTVNIKASPNSVKK